MRRNRIIAGCAVMLIVAAAAAWVVALPAQESYCSICGAREVTRRVALRVPAVTLFRLHKIRETPFSSLLAQKQLVAAHPHRWQAPCLAPDPLKEFGPPVVESLGFLNAPRVVNFMGNVADYADPKSVAKWKGLMMQPAYARVIDEALHFLRVPAGGFANRTEFLAWWGRNSYAVYNRLREQTEPD